ncbi:MAG: DUF6069 family protein [Chloroflexota bacterium]|nr:DUF6069 family protein [Chloroflexota bacterium]
MSVSMSTVAVSSPAPGGSRGGVGGRVVLAGLATTVAAVLANVLVYLAGGALVDYDPRFPPLASAGGAIVFTLVPAVVASLLYAVLLRRAADPPRVFAIVAAVVFVITLIPDFTYIPTVPGVSVAQTAILMLMHVVAAGVIVGMLTGLARQPTR